MLDIFKLNCIDVSYSTQPLLCFKTMHPSSQDFQVGEIKEELKHSISSNM